jgi:hypothetical protein
VQNLRGRGDAICPVEWAAALAAAAPETLPTGAHMLPITHAGMLAERIAAFVDERVVGR